MSRSISEVEYEWNLEKALGDLVEAANRVQPFPVDAPNLPEWHRVKVDRLRSLYDAAFKARSILQDSASEQTEAE